MMRQRVLSALVLFAIVFLAVWYDGPFFSVVLAVCAIWGTLEYFGMAGMSPRHPMTIFGLVWIILFVAVAHFEGSYVMFLFTSAVGLSLICLLFSRDIRKAATSWAWTVAGIIYIGWMLSHFILLRQPSVSGGADIGRDWVLFVLFANMAVDTTAFFVGRAWGRHRLAVRISAKKTWEGSVAGFVAAIAAAIALKAILPNIDITYWHAVFLGGLVGVFAQLGDLAESMLKRSAGVKDAGDMIPGHGGLLDRMDSIIFTVVVVYYYVTYVLT